MDRNNRYQIDTGAACPSSTKGLIPDQRLRPSARYTATLARGESASQQLKKSRTLDMAQRRRDLGIFLKAKRSLLKPEDFGLFAIGRRRTPGLRREEIAQVAGIGVTWYTWIEQGRDIKVSSDTLNQLIHALRISPHDAVYLYSLAGHRPPEMQDPEGKLRTVLQGLLDAHGWPGMAFDGLFDVVAFNDLGSSIFRFDKCESPRGRNQIWRMFMEPDQKKLYVDWSVCARSVVGLLRAGYAYRKDDTALLNLVEELRNASPEFEKMWDESSRSGVHLHMPAGLRLQVAEQITLSFLPIRLEVPMHPGWYVWLLQPADRGTDEALKGLLPRSVRKRQI